MGSHVKPNDPIQEIFENAKRNFLKSLKKKTHRAFLEKDVSIEDVYNEAVKIQQEQSNSSSMRNLQRIQPYLDRIGQYSKIIDTFVQVKPDVLALILGPIQLLLQLSKTLTKSFDAILEAMQHIGDRLPIFQTFAHIFEGNERVQKVLGLFFKDILTFYTVALNFFGLKGKPFFVLRKY